MYGFRIFYIIDGKKILIRWSNNDKGKNGVAAYFKNKVNSSLIAIYYIAHWIQLASLYVTIS